MKKRYWFKNKDCHIVLFEITEDNKINILKIEKDVVYVDIPTDTTFNNSFLSFFSDRILDFDNRIYGDRLADLIGGLPLNLERYLSSTFSLSLNDSFWIVPDDGREYLWKDYNLYDNEFDQRVAEIALFGKSEISNKDVKVTGEYTTKGYLHKSWQRDYSGIYLLKGSGNHDRDIASEEICSEILKTYSFIDEYVRYDTVEIGRDFFSRCKLFTDEHTGFISAYEINKYLKNYNSRFNTDFKDFSDVLGYDFIKKMELFDAIIGNTDRHLGNFGMLVDNDTGEFIRPAPIFDNGMSIFYHLDIKKYGLSVTNYISRYRSCFSRKSFYEIISNLSDNELNFVQKMSSIAQNLISSHSLLHDEEKRILMNYFNLTYKLCDRYS